MNLLLRRAKGGDSSLKKLATGDTNEMVARVARFWTRDTTPPPPRLSP